jgi:hypothetical protein
MGRGKVILRHPAKQAPPHPRECRTGKERFATERAAKCAWNHLAITATDAVYDIEQCPTCDGWHVEWAGLA